MAAEADVQSLLSRAWQARKNSYAPYSGFAVGAALQTSSGAVFAGCNVENISFGVTICAERIAAGAAIEAGEREFVALAVVANSEVPVIPCGACRQFLAEFAPSLLIYSATLAGGQQEASLADLFPFSSAGILVARQSN